MKIPVGARILISGKTYDATLLDSDYRLRLKGKTYDATIVPRDGKGHKVVCDDGEHINIDSIWFYTQQDIREMKLKDLGI
jgi:hypothetical protein